MLSVIVNDDVGLIQYYLLITRRTGIIHDQLITNVTNSVYFGFYPFLGILTVAVMNVALFSETVSDGV